MGFHPGLIMDKPFSQACENNKQAILGELSKLFAGVSEVVEVGSGTGQHAVFFARNMPWLPWQTTDLSQHHAGICLWLEQGPQNALPPLTLDVMSEAWPVTRIEALFSANTLHIMSWDAVKCLFRGLGERLQAGGLACIYGPFNYAGAYTSESNASFDLWLRERDPRSGIRDFEAVDRLAAGVGLELIADRPMPANNRLLCWRRVTPQAPAC